MKLAKSGKRVAVVDSFALVGGNCTHRATIPMVVPRTGAVARPLDDGQVLIVGGTDAATLLQPYLPGHGRANLVDGRVVSLPAYVDAQMLYYRRDLLEKHKLPEPKTWDKLAATARSLRAMSGEDSLTTTRLNAVLKETSAAARAWATPRPIAWSVSPAILALAFAPAPAANEAAVRVVSQSRCFLAFDLEASAQMPIAMTRMSIGIPIAIGMS